MSNDSLIFYWTYYNSLLLPNMFSSIPMDISGGDSPEPPDPPVPPIQYMCVGGLVTDTTDSPWMSLPWDLMQKDN